MKRFAYLLILTCFLSFPTLSPAGSYSVDFILQQVELGKLPNYCAHMGVLHQGRTAEGRQLRAAYGPDWEHMHHFCWALVDSQKGYDGQAIGNLNYVLRNVSASFAFRPMALKQKAQILILNDKPLAAIPVYQELIKVRPKLEDGYLGLANIFQNQGDQKAAYEVIKLGLKNIPDSQKLKNFLE